VASVGPLDELLAGDGQAAFFEVGDDVEFEPLVVLGCQLAIAEGVGEVCMSVETSTFVVVVGDDGTLAVYALSLIAGRRVPPENRSTAVARTKVLRGLAFRRGFFRGFCVWLLAAEAESRRCAAELDMEMF
jgi:hypothetical protein